MDIAVFINGYRFVLAAFENRFRNIFGHQELYLSSMFRFKIDE